jgi:murein DD-endopeptidase MepM/ murein hydrolase activator NlpD
MPLRVFPVAGGARYSDDFSVEATDTSRKHLGNDLMSPTGTPLLAVDDGDVRFGTDPLGGQIANLRSPDGTRYYYAHLSAFEGGNRHVSAGEVIGYVGATGNAAGGPSHCHFEVHPGGGAAVDPYPYLRAATIQQTGAGRTGTSWLLPLAILAAGGYWIYSTEPAAKRWVYKWL